jgi:hypothetical protein
MEIYPFLHDNSLWNLLIRFLVNLGVLFILVGVIYYKFSRKEEYLFSLFLMGVMIFLICSILGSKDLGMGMAIGLFAIFAIIRFRTVSYSVKDITYVFIIIGISVTNSQANIPPHILGAAIVNLSILLITYLLEIYLQKKNLNKIMIIYYKLELLKPGRDKDLLKDLCRQTGQNIVKVIIQKVDIGRSNAELEVYYKETIIKKSKNSNNRENS